MAKKGYVFRTQTDVSPLPILAIIPTKKGFRFGIKPPYGWKSPVLTKGSLPKGWYKKSKGWKTFLGV